jgi:hypothetical protein
VFIESGVYGLEGAVTIKVNLDFSGTVAGQE